MGVRAVDTSKTTVKSVRLPEGELSDVPLTGPLGPTKTEAVTNANDGKKKTSSEG